MLTHLLRNILTLALVISLFSGTVVSVVAQAETDTTEADETTQDSEDSLDIDLETLPVPEAGINMTVSPISLNLDTEPGKSVTAPVKIRNNGTETEYILPEIATFDGSGENGSPVIKPLTDQDTFGQWLSFDQQLIQVRPGEWQTVNVTFNPPEEAALDYYYMLLFKRAQDVNQQTNSTAVSGAPAIFVLANVASPNAVQELQLTEFSMPRVFFEFLPVRMNLKIKNTGNTYLAPTGNIFIDGNNQQDIAVLSINAQNSYILPNSERTFAVEWDEGFPLRVRKVEDGVEVKDDNNQPVYKLEWDFSKANNFRIGKYTANLIMVYDNGERDVPTESQVSFWVVPWRIIAVAIAIPVTPAVLVFLLMKLGSRKKREE